MIKGSACIGEILNRLALLIVWNDEKKSMLAVRNGEVQFLFHKMQFLKRIMQLAQARSVAALNATRWALFKLLETTGLPLETGSNSRMHYNRAVQNYPKVHWIDAACVGESGEQVKVKPKQKLLFITATGRGSRQVVKMNKYDFPRTAAGQIKWVHGFQTSDLVRLVQPKGKYAGIHRGRLAGIRADGRLDLQTSAF